MKPTDISHLDEGDYRAHLRESLQRARLEQNRPKSRIGESFVGLMLFTAVALVLLEHYGIIHLLK